MKTTRRGFLKIMAAGVAVASIPIPVLAKGVMPKPWPVPGEYRIVYFRMVRRIKESLEVNIIPNFNFIVGSATVGSQEDMDALEQAEGFRDWLIPREDQLRAMAGEDVPAPWGILAARPVERLRGENAHFIHVDDPWGET